MLKHQTAGKAQQFCLDSLKIAVLLSNLSFYLLQLLILTWHMTIQLLEQDPLEQEVL